MSVQLTTRPDGRTFVSLRDVAPADIHELIAEARRAVDGPLYAHVDLGSEPLVTCCVHAGFVDQIVSARYAVPFAPFRVLRGRARSGRVQIVPADQVDPTSLFKLDEALRQDVPGLDGWVGDRVMFDDEMTAESFDPSGYLVGQHRDTGKLVGLVRFWRNEPQPALGLLGVIAEHRSGFLAHRLLYAAFEGASTWGSTTFTTHTARPQLQRRLEAHGAVRTGRFAQMIHIPRRR